jgi:hypothetical protein
MLNTIMFRCLLRLLFFACGLGQARRRAMGRRRAHYWYD